MRKARRSGALLRSDWLSGLRLNESLAPFSKDVLSRRAELAFHHVLDHFHQLAFGGNPNPLPAWLVTPLEDEDAGNAGDAKLGGHVGGIIYVQLAHLDPAGELVGNFVDCGAELPAGTAPGGPEIDHHRL